MSYTIQNILADGTIYDITPLIRTIKWGGDIRQAARRLEVELVFGRDTYLPKYNVPLGSILLLRGESGEIVRGVVFDIQKDTSGRYTVISYDHLNYLLKSKGTYKFRNMTADAIIKKLCSDFKIPVGDIPPTGIVLPKIFARDETIYDICVMALTETTKRNGKKYMLRMKQGKLNVIEKGAQVVKWYITEVQNLMDASYSENINEMKNKILVVGDKDEVLAKVEDPELIKQYGVLQELRREGNIKAGEAMTIAKNLLKELGKVKREASITCLGLDDVEAGTAIEVKETLTGLTGTFYVDTDDHTVQNGQHTMSLKLNWTDEVATKDAPKDKEDSLSAIKINWNL
jgi:hypothetical protein